MIYHQVKYSFGIDVQLARGCSYAMLNQDLELVDSGWIKGESKLETCQKLQYIISSHEGGSVQIVAIGIDSPRMPLPSPRKWYWSGDGWRERRPSEKGYGRHCEVAIKVLGIANPQWTRTRDQSPEWMKLGFALFDCLKDWDNVFETFPSASYKMLNNRRDLMLSINFAEFQRGPKDMLDAVIAALTVHEFINYRGSEVGGGDGLGTFILPSDLSDYPSSQVLQWPDEDVSDSSSDFQETTT